MEAKPGVDLRWLSSPAWWGAHVADQVHRELTGRQVVITSTGEGKHQAARSCHYAGGYLGMGRAFDLRIWYLEDPAAFARQLARELGDDFQVLLERTHVHVEWQPVFRPA